MAAAAPPDAADQRDTPLAREHRWMALRMAGVVDELVATIEAGSHACSPSVDVASNSALAAAATLVVSSPNSSVIKGFVTMNGAAITKGDITVRFAHYSRGSPVKVSVNTSRPLILPQITLAHNCLVAALDILQHAKDPEFEDLDMIVLQDALPRVGTFLCKAREALDAPAPVHLFPKREPDPKSFFPDLPEDLIVEFSTKAMSLTTTVYALSLHQQGIPLQFQNKLLGKFKPMKLGTYKGRDVEIIDHVTVESASPRLSEIYAAIDHAEALCRDTMAKLAAFDHSMLTASSEPQHAAPE
ncbi:hypothetical protein HK105_209392 [Polyrhizophydium stewartii]|uniref:RAVE subunit 2/Rogdi n=1 Tax=Polyrhizophydium stewartii TaxID=2732419 RepID=A0ABR4MV55_9FUNG